jgi:hypothetical protein
MADEHWERSRFCEELPRLRAELLRSPERWTVLELAVDMARSGGSMKHVLRQLGIASLSADRGGAPTVSPVAGGGHVGGGVYLCPVNNCGRVEERQVGDELPTCHVYERALRFVPDAR